MISVKQLNKCYKKLQVLTDLTTAFENEKVTVIIGPNGSGKSTLIKCILGLVKPTSGSILVNGALVNGSHLYRNEIGYIPQYGHFPSHLTVLDVLNLVIDIRNISFNLDQSRLPFNIQKEYNKKINTLSGGTRQKLSANIAFMTDSKYYICDEPTAGLDPIANQRFKEHITNLKNNGKTILISSHVISEVEDFADNIIFLCEGQLKYDGEISKLKEQTKEEKLERAVIKLMDPV